MVYHFRTMRIAALPIARTVLILSTALLLAGCASLIPLRDDRPEGAGPVSRQDASSDPAGAPEAAGPGGSLGPFDAGSLTPIVDGAWYEYSDGTRVEVSVTAADEAELRLTGPAGGAAETGALRLERFREERAGRAPTGWIRATGDGNGILLPGLLLGSLEADQIVEPTVNLTKYGTYEPWRPDSYLKKLRIDPDPSVFLSPFEIPGGSRLDRAVRLRVGPAEVVGRTQIIDALGIRELRLVAAPGIGWVYGRVVDDAGTRQIWLEDWHVPAAGNARRAEREELLGALGNPEPAARIEIPGWDAAAGLAAAPPPSSLAGLDTTSSREELTALAGQAPDEEMAMGRVPDPSLAHLEESTMLGWWSSPAMPSTSFFLSPRGETGPRLVQLEWRGRPRFGEPVLAPPGVWNPSFGPGLALGGREVDFRSAGLLSASDLLEGPGGPEIREYQAGSYKLVFRRGAVSDHLGRPLEGYRLVEVRVRLVP